MPSRLARLGPKFTAYHTTCRLYGLARLLAPNLITTHEVAVLCESRCNAELKASSRPTRRNFNLMASGDQWPRYQSHKPLNQSKREIHLLRLDQLQRSSSVRCEILHQSLDDSPQYDALSYYWGAPSATLAVLVN